MENDAKADNSPASALGGTIEPSGRQAQAKRELAKPKDVSERFELRDPFAEVTYHAVRLDEIKAKAKELGITRILAISAAGERTPIYKIGEQWKRGHALPAAQERPLDLGPAQGDRPDQPQPTRQEDAAERPSTRQRARTDSDAERAELTARLEAALNERYIIKRATLIVGDLPIGSTEYRFRGDSSRVAFTESAMRLATDTNSPSVARSMVDVAQARGWTGLRVSGNEDFRRLVWLESSARGVKALGYEPNPADLDALKREQLARQTNRIEPTQQPTHSEASTAGKSSSRGSGGRKAVIAAIEAVLISKGVPEARRNAVLTVASEKLAQRAARGQKPAVKVYDLAAGRVSGLARTAEADKTRARTSPELTR